MQNQRHAVNRFYENFFRKPQKSSKRAEKLEKWTCFVPRSDRRRRFASRHAPCVGVIMRQFGKTGRGKMVMALAVALPLADVCAFSAGAGYSQTAYAQLRDVSMSAEVWVLKPRPRAISERQREAEICSKTTRDGLRANPPAT